MTKEEVLKLIEGRIETMQQPSIECIELIYNAGYNTGIDDAARLLDISCGVAGDDIRELKRR